MGCTPVVAGEQNRVALVEGNTVEVPFAGHLLTAERRHQILADVKDVHLRPDPTKARFDLSKV